MFVVVLKIEDPSTCNVPICHFYPKFKQRLEGQAWRQAINYLLRLKCEKSSHYEKYLEKLYVYAKVCDIKFSAQVKYIDECEWCNICNYLFCDSDDCPREIKTVTYEDVCIFTNNAEAIDLLRWIDCKNVFCIQFTIDNRSDTPAFTDNHRCPIHVNSDRYLCKLKKGERKLSLDYY